MKKILFIIIILISIALSGCWGKKELGEISIVRVTGIDVEPNGDIRVTILSEEPTGVKGGEQSMRSSTSIITAVDSNIRSAFKTLMIRSSKRPVWVQNDIILISEEAANKVLDEIMDFLTRNRNIRLDNNVLFSKKRTVDLLQLPSGVQGSLVEDIRGMVENTKYFSKAYVADLKTFVMLYTDKNISPVTAEIDFYKSPVRTVSVGREAHEMMEPGKKETGILYINGCATLKHNGSIGILNNDETQGYLWIMDKVKDGIIEIPGLDGKGKVVMVNITSKVDKRIEVNDGNITIIIDLKVDGDIGIKTSHDDLHKDTIIREIEKKLSEKVKSKMKLVVKKSQKEFKADIFGFSQLVYRNEPKLWKEIHNKWEQIYSDLEVKYNVECIIKHMGLLNESLIK